MAFTYDTTTDIGKVRLLIHDQVNLPDHPAHYSDAEIQIFLDSGGSVKLAAAEALEAWAAYYSDSPDSEKMGDYSYTKKGQANMLALADRYRKSEEDTPAMEIASMDLTFEADE